MNIRYTRGKEELVVKKDVTIGRMPIMLKSSNCVLNGKSEEQLAKLNECPIDQGNTSTAHSLRFLPVPFDFFVYYSSRHTLYSHISLTLPLF